MSAIDRASLQLAHKVFETNQRALAYFPSLLPQILPGGNVEGLRYIPLNPTRVDRRRGSFSINMETGEWGEFAKGHEACGVGAVSLIQYIKGMSAQTEAVSLLSDALKDSRLTEVQRDYRPRPRGKPITPIPIADFIDDEDFKKFALGLVPGHEPTDAFAYTDAKGSLIFVTLRFRNIATGAKTFRPACFVEWPDNNRGWSSQLPQMRLPPFNLEQLLRRPAAPVLLVEGERTADAASKLFSDYVVVTSANGSSSARQTDWSPLAGRDVTIWPDHDEAGAGYARDVQALARAAGARSLDVVALPPGLPQGWDLADEPPQGFDPTAVLTGTQPATQVIDVAPVTGVRSLAAATPFVMTDPRGIEPREVIYEPYQRKFLSALAAPPKTGKTALEVAESLAMVTGRNLLGTEPFEPMRVWIICEDPRDELQRRVTAAAMRYQVGPEDLAGRLFVDSFREKKLLVADKTAAGVVINYPLVDALTEEIRQRGIDHVFVDPFVSTHRVPENDNGAIADAAQAWNEVADRANCSICLVHHTRKTNGHEVTIDDMRGGSSLLGVVRSVRTLNQLAEGDVARAKVEPEQRRRYIRIGAGASNMFAPTDRSAWFYLESVDLGNTTYRRPSDQVGVAVPWSWPTPEAREVTREQLAAIQSMIGHGTCKYDAQARDWAGQAVAEVLGLDVADKPAIKLMLKRWEEDGTLKKEKEFDRKKGREIPVYRVGNSVFVA